MLKQNFEMDPFLQIKPKDYDAHSLYYSRDCAAQSPAKSTGIKRFSFQKYWIYSRFFPLKGCKAFV